jgi:hypothetical protein
MDRRISNGDEERFVAKRIVRRFSFAVDAPPEVVFPLLCPVREREWIQGWKAEMIYSESGLVENNCIFTTENRHFGEAIYVTSRYEKGIVEFVIFFPGKCIQKLDVVLTPGAGGGTNLLWSRTYTGLSAEGNALVEQITEGVFREQTAVLATALRRYCKEREEE